MCGNKRLEHVKLLEPSSIEVHLPPPSRHALQRCLLFFRQRFLAFALISPALAVAPHPNLDTIERFAVGRQPAVCGNKRLEHVKLLEPSSVEVHRPPPTGYTLQRCLTFFRQRLAFALVSLALVGAPRPNLDTIERLCRSRQPVMCGNKRLEHVKLLEPSSVSSNELPKRAIQVKLYKFAFFGGRGGRCGVVGRGGDKGNAPFAPMLNGISQTRCAANKPFEYDAYCRRVNGRDNDMCSCFSAELAQYTPHALNDVGGRGSRLSEQTRVSRRDVQPFGNGVHAHNAPDTALFEFAKDGKPFVQAHLATHPSSRHAGSVHFTRQHHAAIHAIAESKHTLPNGHLLHQTRQRLEVALRRECLPQARLFVAKVGDPHAVVDEPLALNELAERHTKIWLNTFTGRQVGWRRGGKVQVQTGSLRTLTQKPTFLPGGVLIPLLEGIILLERIFLFGRAGRWINVTQQVVPLVGHDQAGRGHR